MRVKTFKKYFGISKVWVEKNLPTNLILLMLQLRTFPCVPFKLTKTLVSFCFLRQLLYVDILLFERSLSLPQLSLVTPGSSFSINKEFLIKMHSYGSLSLSF